jgi:hypothetical protein
VGAGLTATTQPPNNGFVVTTITAGTGIIIWN